MLELERVLKLVELDDQPGLGFAKVSKISISKKFRFEISISISFFFEILEVSKFRISKNFELHNKCFIHSSTMVTNP